jgi:hypothetical protein
MPVQRRASKYSSRTVVPLDLRPLVRRREIVRSLETSDLKDARLRAAQWEGHVAGPFRRLRQNGRTMDQEQIDALVSQYLDAGLQEVETRPATGAWSVAGNNHAEHADWYGVARSLLADQAEELEEALAYNNLTATLGIAQQMLAQSTTEAQQVLARRLLETKYEAVMAELRALQGKPLPRRTVGAKTSWLNHRLLVNSAVYYIDWKSIQVSDFVTSQNNSDTFTSNAGTARVIGAELEVDALPLEGLELSATLGYSNAKLTENQPTQDPAFGARDGNRFPLVPELSGSFSAQYSWHLANQLQPFVRADYSYTGGQGTQFNPENPLYNYVPAYSLFNGRVGVRGGNYEAALYINNATNHYAINILQEASDHTPRGIVPERPRTIGLDLRYRF